MTSKDKTGDQLVASIRKSKTGTVSRKTADRSSADEANAKSKPPAKSTSPAPKTRASTNSQAGKLPKDPYSLGRRVWPD